MKFKDMMIKAGRKVSKHSPAIFTTVGIVGLGATAYLAYRSRSKVEAVVMDIEDKRMNEEPLNKFETVRDIVEATWQPVAVGALSVACILMSHKIQRTRILTLSGALAAQQARNIYFEHKYRKQHGEEAYKEFMVPKSREEKVELDKDGKETVVIKDIKKDVDKTIGQWYSDSEHYTSDDHTYNIAMIDSVNDRMQAIIFQRGTLLLNEVREALGFERIRAGAILGWSTSDTFDIEKMTTTVEVDGEIKEEIWVHWSKPRYIHDDMDFSGRYSIY
jgi:Family of unknown function (DUF6353)